MAIPAPPGAPAAPGAPSAPSGPAGKPSTDKPLAADLQAALLRPNLYVGSTANAAPDDPPFVVVFGETNTGKTTTALEFAAGGGLILTQPGGATTAKTVVGVDLTSSIQHVHRFEELPDWIYWAGANGFTSVYVDDGTLLMGNTLADAGRQWAIWKDVKNETTGIMERRIVGYDRAMYQYLKPVVTEVGRALRWAKIPGLITCHPQNPYVHKTDGRFPLGPDLQWGKLVRLLPCESDICLHATGKPVGVTGPRPPGSPPPPPVPPWDFRCNAERGNPDVATGDRYDITPEKDGPLNIAEIVREAAKLHGYRFDVPRPNGLEWMEGVAEDVALNILSGTAEIEATRPWAEHLLREGHHFTHVRWATKDGVHRARLRKARQANALAGLL